MNTHRFPLNNTIYFLLVSVFVFACSPSKTKRNIETGFYYWKTVFKLSANEKAYADSLHVQKLYVRLFDLDTLRNENGVLKIVPVSILQYKDTFSTNYKIIPVVYITRLAMLYSSDEDSLASKIGTITQKISEKYHFAFDEIQWDMDWTPATKEPYFKLLNELHKNPFLKTKIFSATLRLHQVKFQSQTGIPPVDKVYLMCYNMGNLQQYGNKNSIFDLQLCKDYFGNISKYPLPLSIALPIFHWSVLFRDEQFVGILHDISLKDIVGNSNFKKLNENLFIANHDGFLRNYFIRQYDEIRIEEVSSHDLKACATFLSKHIEQDTLQILFYHLNDSLIQQYPTHEIQKVLDAF